MNPVTLRRAVQADIEAVATIWHDGWRDGHLGHVPVALEQHRRPVDFLSRVPGRLDDTVVAVVGSAVVGFVMVRDDEIEQLYVAAPARGTGVAAALLGRGEALIGARFDRAWLAVVAGNTRARRFYERNGWSDAGPFVYPAGTAAGPTIPVPVLRYEKLLALTPEAAGEGAGD
jgi:GNAT superfamily N-acetyltransferase